MIDTSRIQKNLLELLAIPSPCGFTDEIVHYICESLIEMNVEYDLTRRGTIRAKIPGKNQDTSRGIVTHIDSIGAVVRYIRDDGRMLVAPIGFWSSRFAEGARCTLFSENRAFRATLLPQVEWGVSRDKGVDDVPVNWEQIELRLDEPVYTKQDVRDLGVEIGDFIAFDSNPEVLDNGYIIGRNLDNKAGAAAALEAIRLIKNQPEIENDTYFLFTISETIGSGSGAAVLPSVSELLTVDFASLRSNEKSPFKRVTLATGDASGPYDYHLTAHIEKLAVRASIPYQKKHLKAFHSDAAAALTAGHDVRTAVIAYAGDASHSVERTHMESLVNVVRLLMAYVTSSPTFENDDSITSVTEFSHQINEDNKPKPLKRAPHISEVLSTSESSASSDKPKGES